MKIASKPGPENINPTNEQKNFPYIPTFPNMSGYWQTNNDADVKYQDLFYIRGINYDFSTVF